MVAPRSPQQPPTGPSFKGLFTAIVRWFDSAAPQTEALSPADKKVDWARIIPFLGLHLGCLGIIWVGWSPVAIGVAVFLYGLRMFAITGFYHRYFSHKAFRTSRAAQFLFAMLGASAVQRGPLWWAGHHRHHHAHSDRPDDAHSPVQHGFLWSHAGWFLTEANFRIRWEWVKDWARYPELRWLDRFDVVLPIVLALALFVAGHWLEIHRPGLGVTGAQLLVWGFAISTVVLYHATFSVNSLAHTWGWRRYATRDDSRNNALLAMLTLGEGWHNNHHHYPGAARQGFYWWEIDLTYYLLKALAHLGIIWDLKPVPVEIRNARHLRRQH